MSEIKVDLFSIWFFEKKFSKIWIKTQKYSLKSTVKKACKVVTILFNPYAVCWFLILCVFILQITALKHSGRVGTRIVTKPKPSRSQPTRAIPPAWSMHILTTLGTWGWAKFLIRDLLQDFGISSVNQFSWNIPVSTPEGLIHKWIFCKYISFILLSFFFLVPKQNQNPINLIFSRTRSLAWPSMLVPQWRTSNGWNRWEATLLCFYWIIILNP